MDKIYNLFKKFLPLIIAISSVGLLLGLLSSIYYYDSTTVSINFKNVIPILTVLFLVSAIGIVIFFTTKIDTLHIAKIKKSFGFCKFAAALASALAAALFFFDFFRFVQTPTTSSPLRILRILIFVPFIVYLALGLVPSKIKKKRITLPSWLKPTVCICAIIWSILGLLMIYFWNGLPTTNLYKITYMFYYVLLVLFFLFEAKFELLKPSPKMYVLTSLLLFVYTFVIIGSTVLAKFLGFLDGVSISEFELFLALALGIYALSKMIAVQQTIKYVMNKHSGPRHHHRHSSGSDANEAEGSDASKAEGSTTDTTAKE